MSAHRLSALVVAHNEEKRLAACLEKLAFADEIVVVLDACTDGTRRVAEAYTERFVEGDWPTEGGRRNAGIEACRGPWIMEVDADEHVGASLADEVLKTIESSQFDWHEIPVDNYIGARLVRWGWGASYGKAAYPGLFRKGVKVWGDERVHPRLTWSGRRGPMLAARIDHFVDRDVSDMLRRLDSYSTARAKDLRDRGEIDGVATNIRRFFSRFFKCYVMRRGYREGGLGFLIAVLAGLYPLLSHLKAAVDATGSDTGRGDA